MPDEPAVNINKSTITVSGSLPLTDEEAELFKMDDIHKTVYILGRKYALMSASRSSDGTFSAELMPLTPVKFPTN